MKILHTADWHIGSFKGPEKDGVNLRGEDTMNCLRELVRVAQEKKPELTLVSGDIFHQAEIWQGRSHREVLQAREIIMKLAEVSENVVVMRGTPNHDSAEAFAELQAHFELVPNVEVVTEPKVVNTPYAQIAVLPGFDRGTFRAKFPGLSKEQENEVFSNEIGNIVAGLRAMCQNESRIAVLMSHYTVPGCNMESGQTQFLMQFEPVITREMLLAADYDLVALGHIHRPQKLEGMKNVFYSGAINAMNFNDEGQDRGFMLHEFRPDYEKMKLYYEGTQFRKTPSREFLTIRWNKEDVAQAISNPDMLPMTFTDQGVADKIVRIIYSCTSDQKKAINTAQIEKALYEAGAFWKADIVMDKLEDVNRTELSKFDDPETNLIQYLTEKDIEPGQINRIVERARPIIARALASSSTADSSGSFVPKQIEVKNYRNYVEESFSFDDISFCTINGQNGAGKSSLFMDAILDCLYEEPREGSNTGWIRNDEKARSGSISFTFGLGEKTYRVVRTRAKSGKGTLNLSELIEGEWIDRSKEKYKDTQDEIIKVLGMDSLTFKACVLIMQDQYGLFLEAGKDIRIDVLSNLIGLEIYNSMEDMAGAELAEMRRQIARQKNTISIHESTIAGYGKPQEELDQENTKLELMNQSLEGLRKDREERTVTLRTQKEAAERRKRVQASVDTLKQKRAAVGQIISAYTDTITGCDAELAKEAEVMEKVHRRKTLQEADKDLLEAATLYQSKVEELGGLNRQMQEEQETVDALKKAEQEKQNAMHSMILESVNDGEVRQKAAEYDRKSAELEAMQEKAVAYQKAKTEYSAAVFHESETRSGFDREKQKADEQKQVLEKKVAILNESGCVDIENAHCKFLQDAIEAKEQLAMHEALYTDIAARRDCELAKSRQEIADKQAEMDAIGFDAEAMGKLMRERNDLLPFVSGLKEIEQREKDIALIKAELTNIRSNILEAEKRLLQVKSKAQGVEEVLSTCREAAEKHKDVENQIRELEPYEEIAANYPVLKERKKNAETQRANEVTRLEELGKELEEAEKELEVTTGATMDIATLESQIVTTTKCMEVTDKQISEIHQTIGSLNQKIEEIERLQEEISDINRSVRQISADFAECELLKAAFSKAGIPHQIIRTLVPKLTEISSSILGQMTGGKAGIEFQLERMQKNQKEVTALDIYIDEYGKSVLPYLSKSGGEKVRASLSVILALAEIKSSSAGIQLGMLFIDEPPFLDGEGIQAYCDALETIQHRYPNLKIMAITHDPTMKARFPQSVDVIKTENGSKVIYE